jgi:MYXO-CTERM domain-containing protein
MYRVLLAASAVAVAASAASADVVFTLNNFRIEGSELTQFAVEGDLSGVLTGATIDIVMTAWTNYTYADDLCIYLAEGPTFTQGGALQIGGFNSNSMDAEESYTLPTQNQRTQRTLRFIDPIDLTGKGLHLWIGNGFGGSTTTGTWNGTITLHGVTGIPAPGALALLGLAGLTGRRRR